MKTVVIFALIIIFVLSLTTFCGCIDEKSTNTWPEREIKMMATTLTINYTEAMRVNLSEVSPSLWNVGFTTKDFTNSSTTIDGTKYDRYYGFENWTCPNPLPATLTGRIFFGLMVWQKNDTSYSVFDITYTPSNATVKNLESEKSFLRQRANETAQICNLTLNWTNVQFVVSYSD